MHSKKLHLTQNQELLFVKYKLVTEKHLANALKCMNFAHIDSNFTVVYKFNI